METYTQLPKKFGKYGGQFVPEVLMPALEELEKAYVNAQKDLGFQSELQHLLATYVGRPTPLTFAKRLTSYRCSQDQ
jgi:tryptophan synthase beta chain